MNFGRVRGIHPVGFLDQCQKLPVVCDLRQIPGYNVVELEMQIRVTHVVHFGCSGIANDDRVTILIATNVHGIDRCGEFQVDRHGSSGGSTEGQTQVCIGTNDCFSQKRSNPSHCAFIFGTNFDPVLRNVRLFVEFAQKTRKANDQPGIGGQEFFTRGNRLESRGVADAYRQRNILRQLHVIGLLAFMTAIKIF